MQNTKVTEKRFRRSGPAGTSAYVSTAAREDEMKRKGKKEMKKIELDSIAIPQALDLAVEKGIQKGKQELRKKKRKKIFSVLLPPPQYFLFLPDTAGPTRRLPKTFP